MADTVVSQERSADLVVGDPLSLVTRRERRNLLVASVVGVVMVNVGLTPSKIAALGIEFTPDNQSVLRSILGIVVLYFGAAFLLYGTSDFLAWRLALHKRIREGYRRHEERMRQPPSKEPTYEIRDIHLPLEMAMTRALGPVSVLRAIFEFALPLGIGAYAAWLLLSR